MEGQVWIGRERATGCTRNVLTPNQKLSVTALRFNPRFNVRFNPRFNPRFDVRFNPRFDVRFDQKIGVLELDVRFDVRFAKQKRAPRNRCEIHQNLLKTWPGVNSLATLWL